MNKFQLEVGYHYAEFRNGKKAVLLYNEFGVPAFVGLNGKYISTDNLKSDLTHVRVSKFDVVKIGVMGSHKNTNMFDYVQWIWERQETKQLTVADVEALVGCKVEIIR